MALGELSRLYQAALEERRFVHERMREMTASESYTAITHIEREVARARNALELEWLGGCCG